jgi:predicted MPP superfamily phosphohydrolase
LIAFLSITVAWIAWGNTAVETNVYIIENEDVPFAFDGFRIAQISDFHDAEIGKDNERLLKMLRESKPDIIVITGDFIDSRRTDVGHSLDFAKEAVKIAPCYYVTGNHEGRVPEYKELREGLIELGVCVLENEAVGIERDGEVITLIGVHDQSMGLDGGLISELGAKENIFTLLIAHRPATFSVARDSGIDLLLCGHVHGGQFRIPLLGGVFGPGQGFFPEHDAGLFVEDATTMIISRGIGNSAFPFRVNNRPEIVVAELHPKK